MNACRSILLTCVCAFFIHVYSCASSAKKPLTQCGDENPFVEKVCVCVHVLVCVQSFWDILGRVNIKRELRGLSRLIDEWGLRAGAHHSSASV